MTSKKNKEFFYEICKRLKTLEAYTQVVPDTPQFSEKVKGIATMRESDEEPKIVMRSKTKTRKLLKSFSRSTFPDVDQEESSQSFQNQYSAKTIYKWNIDGVSDYNILKTFQ